MPAKELLVSTHEWWKGIEFVPSQGSGSFLAARSSMENLISFPFSSRDSGSAFMSQYCRPMDEAGLAPFAIGVLSSASGFC